MLEDVDFMLNHIVDPWGKSSMSQQAIKTT